MLYTNIDNRLLSVVLVVQPMDNAHISNDVINVCICSCFGEYVYEYALMPADNIITLP